MKQLLVLFSLIQLGYTGMTQNLIPNSSFEDVNYILTKWSETDATFNRSIQQWNSPTQGSPDVLHVGSLDKINPKREKIDISSYMPKTGEFMAGIKTYGCQTNTLHCKEYLQIKLDQPLTIGEQYYFEYWICPVELSVKVNSFGLAFSIDEVHELNDGLIDIYPISMNDDIIYGDSDSKWQRISGKFEAEVNYEYLIIGNFADDDFIKFEKEENGMRYGYYLLDDVLLRADENDLDFKVNEVVVMDNILFEFDNSELYEDSELELDKLAAFLYTNSTYEIKILGHTDNKGSLEYNMKLSQDRADTIRNYLVTEGIDISRIRSIGLGSAYPISNDNSLNSQKINRRVEIEIIDK